MCQVVGYRFAVTRDASHYLVHAGSEWVYTGYDGNVWIDPKTLELRRLTVRTGELPEGTTACKSTTTVDYASMRIGTGEFLLPQPSSLHFLMRDMGESDVAIAYSGCHQFHGEANLVTDPSAIAKESEAPHAAISIPEGLLVPLKLSQSIDTDTAAAGDVVLATVSGDVRDRKSGETVVKDGSIVGAVLYEWPTCGILLAVSLLQSSLRPSRSIAFPRHSTQSASATINSSPFETRLQTL